MKKFTPEISDHALVRWLERVHGIDIEFFRNEMLREFGPVLSTGVTKFRSGKNLYAADGFGRLVTVYPGLCARPEPKAKRGPR